jgi:3-hydroxybutyryl-CoA dehydrogenase
MDICSTGVVGAGVIGVGVAQALASAGFDVVLVDVSQAILQRAHASMTRNLRLQGFFKKPAVPADDVLGRVTFTTDLSRLRDTDVVVENVTERWNVKAGVYRELDAVCGDRALFVANSSVFPITRIAALTRRPTRVIGMHFMNPVPIQPLVEVVCGDATAADTLSAALSLVDRMGKEAVVVRDSPGYVSNRVLMLMVNEAASLLEERVASAEGIDRIFTAGAGHRMGPLATADLIGLDTVLDSLDALHDLVGEPKYRACPLLRNLVGEGLLGCKTGRGFFAYGESDL